VGLFIGLSGFSLPINELLQTIRKAAQEPHLHAGRGNPALHFFAAASPFGAVGRKKILSQAWS
jgi:hypothetical protein